MTPFEEMYYHLFNAITDALCEMDKQDYESAAQILIAAQQWSEDTFVENQ